MVLETDAAGLREQLTRAAPHKMDENLWRTREQLEEVVVLCRDNAVLRVPYPHFSDHVAPSAPALPPHPPLTRP